MKKRLSYVLLLISLLMMNTLPVLAAEGEYSESGSVNFGMAIIVGLIVAAIVCYVLYSNMKSVHTASSAKRYEKENTFNVSVSRDTYTHTTEQVIHHEPNNPQGGK